MTTNLYEIAFRSIKADRQLALEFSVVIARFEYAIKRCGYRRGARCSAAWRRLGMELDPSNEAFNSENVERSIAYLNQKPPKFLNANMDWTGGNLEGDTDLARALDAAVRVRNNLFHGRKGDKPIRNNRLFSESLVLIAAILDARQDIRDAYRYPG